MTCGYCGFRNSEDEHRCRRCGRKPGDSLSGPAVNRTSSALATAMLVEVVVPAAAEETPDLSQAVQGTLFTAKPTAKVIPFESFAGARTESRTRTQPDAPRKAAVRPPGRRVTTRISDEIQGSLDFLPAAPAAPRTLGTTVEAVISCEAPVATPLHRAVAAGLDWAMVFIGYGLFLLAFHLGGGTFAFTKTNEMVFAGTLPFVAFTYGLLWTLAGTETPGMRWAQLRLTTFEGVPLEPRQRILRFAGSCLSCCTLIGLLWALADEESLNWQDHISRTFPSPRALDSRVFHRQ